MVAVCYHSVLSTLTSEAGERVRMRTGIEGNTLCLFMYTASVIFDYYCRDSELSYIGGIGFQSTPPLEGAGVFNVPDGDSPQNTEPPFIA